jgi:hypothetical protein
MNPFNVETFEKGEGLMQTIVEARRIYWNLFLNEIDMKHSSKKAWDLIKRLDGDPTKSHDIRTVSPNQVTHQLLLNGKTNQENSKGKKNIG